MTDNRLRAKLRCPLRTCVAVPLAILGAFLFAASALLFVVADRVAGRSLSREMLG